MRNEKHYGVPLEVALSLGNSMSQYTIDGLIEMLGFSQNSMVQTAILKGLKIRNSKIKDLIISFLEKDNLSYGPRQLSLEILGFQEGIDINYFKGVVEKYKKIGYVPFVAIGALKGIANTKQPDGCIYLMSLLDDVNFPERLKIDCITSLYEMAIFMDHNILTQIEEKLISLLHDTSYYIRREAIQGLGSLRTHRALDNILEVYNQFSNQDQDWIDDVTKDLKLMEGDNSFVLRILNETVNHMKNKLK